MRSTINVKRGAVLAAAAIKKAVAARTAAASAAVPNGVAIPFAVFVRRLDDGFHRVAVSCKRGRSRIVGYARDTIVFMLNHLHVEFDGYRFVRR